MGGKGHEDGGGGGQVRGSQGRCAGVESSAPWFLHSLFPRILSLLISLVLSLYSSPAPSFRLCVH